MKVKDRSTPSIISDSMLWRSIWQILAQCHLVSPVA